MIMTAYGRSKIESRGFQAEPSVVLSSMTNLHFGDGECSMHGMMDCCEAVLMANDSPEIAAAKLC